MCTCITLKSRQDDYFFGRTMDFFTDFFSPKFPLEFEMSSYPAQQILKGEINSWKSKYSFGGVNIKHTLGFVDGINECGLAGEMNMLEECSWDSKKGLAKRGLKPLIGEEVVSFFLSQFKSVSEIKTHVSQFGLLNFDFLSNVNLPFEKFPLHYTFVDTSGESVVLEPVNKGAFKVYKSMGVMTNSPEYSWQKTNLRNYVGLQGYGVGSQKLSKTVNNSDIDLKQIGYGSGLLGAPGDYTSPSRFVRATFLSRYIDDFDSSDGINTLYNTFNSVMVPKGVEKLSKEAKNGDFTQYFSAYDLTNLSFYVKPYDTNLFTQMKLNPRVSEKHVEISHQPAVQINQPVI